MKNENKCFFSVSLENGIVITGENPRQVFYFLLDLEHALIIDYEIAMKESLKYSAESAIKLWKELKEASKTIENHINMED